MARRKLSEATRWQIIGMRNARLSLRQIGRQLERNISIIPRLLNKYRATNDVEDCPRPGRPRKTTIREDRAVLRLVRRHSWDSSTSLKQHWLPGRAISYRTVRNQLKAAGYIRIQGQKTHQACKTAPSSQSSRIHQDTSGYRARRLIKRVKLPPAHKAAGYIRIQGQKTHQACKTASSSQSSRIHQDTGPEDT